jgi:hypothetical protein
MMMPCRGHLTLSRTVLGLYHVTSFCARDIYHYICRACVGRNLAFLELLMIISSVFRRFDIVLEYPNKPVSQSNHSAGLAVADALIAPDERELFEETSELCRGFETTFDIVGQL